MTEMHTIGGIELLEGAPTVVTVAGGRYVLGRDGDGDPILFSAVCPHQRGRVRVVDESTLRCPNHRWEFDPTTGDPIRGEDSLDTYEVTTVDGDIRAKLD